MKKIIYFFIFIIIIFLVLLTNKFQNTVTGLFVKEAETVNAEISYEVINPTKIIIDENLDLNYCPMYKKFEINITNIGKETAHNLKLKNSNNTIVTECSPCKIKQLLPNEKKSFSFKACEKTKDNVSISIYGINTNTIEVK